MRRRCWGNWIRQKKVIDNSLNDMGDDELEEIPEETETTEA